MADISKLARVINGANRNVDLSTNSLVLGSLKLDTTELTKTILDKLLLINTAADSDGTFDTRYTQISNLAATTASNGASLVGIQDTGAYYIGTTVEAALQELGSALGTGDAASISYDNATSGLTATNVQDAIDEVEDRLEDTETVASAAIPATQKGAANGVATLDENTLIPIGQIPPAALERLVIVADEAARFALTTATVQLGDTVKQTDTGIMYFVKDDAELDSAAGYEIYSAGTASAVAWSGVTGTPTTIAGYGITDADEVAKAAAVADSITNDVTDVAPSQNAVFDALALKQDASSELDEAETFFGASNITGAEAEQLTDGSNADSLHSHSKITESKIAGEAFAADTLWAVRYAKAADAGFTAGRVYKTDTDASSVDNFYVIGLARPASLLAAADPIVITKHGIINVPSHGFTVGAPLFLSTSGAVTATAPSATDSAVVRVGMVVDANNIDVQIQVMGVA